MDDTPHAEPTAARTVPLDFDFNPIATQYDQHRRPGGPFMPCLIRLAQETDARRVLEIGPGTGNVSQAFLAGHSCALTGLDRSTGMMGRAREKDVNAAWVCGDAHDIPLASRCVDFVYGVLVLHHLANLAQAFGEWHRVLAKGYAAFATAPHAFIHAHPLNEFFPSFAAVDAARFPSEKRLADLFYDAGFTDVSLDYSKAAPEPLDERYLEKVANRFISTLRLVPEDEYADGLMRMRERVKREGSIGVVQWESVVVCGRKA